MWSSLKYKSKIPFFVYLCGSVVAKHECMIMDVVNLGKKMQHMQRSKSALDTVEGLVFDFHEGANSVSKVAT